MAESSVTADSSTRDSRRRFSMCLGIVAGLFILYLVVHHICPADEPGRVLWMGPVGITLEWVWWAGTGAAVRALTTWARRFYQPTKTSHSPAARWPSLLVVVSTALLVLILFAIRVVVRIDASAAILLFSFARSPGEILALVAFGLGFFHLLTIAYFQFVARTTWKTVRCAVVSLPESWQGSWQGMQAMWQDWKWKLLLP